MFGSSSDVFLDILIAFLADNLADVEKDLSAALILKT